MRSMRENASFSLASNKIQKPQCLTFSQACIRTKLSRAMDISTNTLDLFHEEDEYLGFGDVDPAELERVREEWMNASPAERRQLEAFGEIRVSQQNIDEIYADGSSTLYRTLIYSFGAFQLALWFFVIAPNLSTTVMVAYPFMITIGSWFVYNMILMDDPRKEKED